jgi:ABC-2 type transport system permease protein
MLDKVLIYLPSSLATVFEYLSVDYHFSNVARGVIDTRDLIYYLSAVSFALFMGTIVLQKRKWA